MQAVKVKELEWESYETNHSYVISPVGQYTVSFFARKRLPGVMMEMDGYDYASAIRALGEKG